MIEGSDGRIEGNPPIDTRDVEYFALVEVCRAYLDGRIKRDKLALFHCHMDYNAHKQKQTFGDHPIFSLMDFLWHWSAQHSLPDEMNLTDKQRQECGADADNELRMKIGYQIVPMNGPQQMIVLQT